MAEEQKSLMDANEKWERLNTVRNLFMGLALFSWALQIVTVLDKGRHISWDANTISLIGELIGVAGWIIAGLMERKARKIAEGLAAPRE
jgi:hypothetical protein